MNRRVLLVVALAAWLPWRAAPAAVFERDWKTPGDGLLTYDDVNQREWLDLTESRLAQFPGANFAERFQSALLELQPGGMFEGFIAAKEADLVSFADSAGINTSTYSFTENEDPTSALITLVGPSLFTMSGGSRSFGILDDAGVTPPPASLPPHIRLTGELFVNPGASLPQTSEGSAGLFVAVGAGDLFPTINNTGMWLFRVIPEPTGVVQCGLGFFALFAFHSTSRRRRTWQMRGA